MNCRNEFIYFLMIVFVIFGLNCSTGKSDRFVSDESAIEFSIKLPIGWDVLPKFKGTIVTAFSPIKDDKDKFKEFINIVQQILPKSFAQDEYFAISEKRMKNVLSDFKVIEKESQKINEIPVNKIVYTYTVKSDDNSIVLIKALSYQVFFGDVAYLITCGSDPKDYDNYLPIFESTCKSFAEE